MILTMANRSKLRGYYWGIDRVGKVVSVSEISEGNSVYLVLDFRRHRVKQGRTAQAEVRIVYGLSDVRFVHVNDLDTEIEKKIIAELEEKAKQTR